MGLVLVLAGCARPTGDFDRAAADPLHDQVMPAVGQYRAVAAKEPVSGFNLTDQEREMRDRIWHYLVSPHAYDWFGDTVAELQRTRIIPTADRQLKTDLYYGWLHSSTYASSHTRYARIGDDVTVDIQLMPDVFASICAVEAVDRQRGIAANGIDDLDDKTKADASARQVENRTQIAWFVGAVDNRYESYNYALDHLLVETPHEEAVRVNGLLSNLALYVDAARSGDFCDPVSLDGRNGHGPALRSRVLRSDRVTKGS